MEQPDLNVSGLWQRYKNSADREVRNKLIENYAPLVKYIAGRMAIGMPGSIEIDDLYGFGVFGLMDAIDKFEPERGIKFETYASTRIRGAIVDGLRSIDWVPRSIRAKTRQIEETIARLEAELHRSPTDQEIADALGLPLERYLQLLDEVRSTSVLSLDEVINPDSGDEPIKMIDAVRDESAAVEESLLGDENLSELASAVDQLPERERTVISLYYHEGMTLKEIGHIMDVSESRICQIHAKAILTLRTKLDWL